MLQEAPDPSGQRYAAVALHIAHRKGVEAFVDVAKAEDRKSLRGCRNFGWRQHIIIPFLLNDFSNDTGITFDIKLVGSDINSPTNTIFMSADEHYSFRCFHFYLEAYPNSPNKYRAQMVQNGRTFTNGQDSIDVEFRAKEDSGVTPPDPQFLRIHAAFAKVLSLCGAADYIENVERDAESATTLRMDDKTDFGSLLMARLPAAVWRTSRFQSCSEGRVGNGIWCRFAGYWSSFALAATTSHARLTVLELC
ncbi:hypothetical protein B0H19DRAFT_1056001 [Mycena capillaripes]|nr:hypothetical protein B0H19DRAFT_1056001 [Mycena capillaripes]